MTLDQMKSLGKEDVLNMLGLETRRGNADYVVTALTAFSVGALLGAGLGVLFAPRSGRELREGITQRLHHSSEVLATVPQRASEALHRATDTDLPNGRKQI